MNRVGQFSRRHLLGTAAAVLGIGAGSAIAYQFGLWRRRWPHTPYDDLLDRLDLREEAVTLGKAVRAAEPGFDAKASAARLRGALAHQALDDLAAADAAAGRVVEIAGWILPQSVADLAALAAG